MITLGFAIAIGLPLAVLILAVTLPERRDKPCTLRVPVNRTTGTVAQTVQPTVTVTAGGIVITAFPGGGCRGNA